MSEAITSNYTALNYSTQNNKLYCTLKFDIKAIYHKYLIRKLRKLSIDEKDASVFLTFRSLYLMTDNFRLQSQFPRLPPPLVRYTVRSAPIIIPFAQNKQNRRFLFKTDHFSPLILHMNRHWESRGEGHFQKQCEANR